MFGGILTKILGGALILSLLGSGFLYVKGKWQKAKDDKLIQELQTAAIKYQATIYKLEAEAKDKQVVIKYREVRTRETGKIDSTVNAGDSPGMDAIFIGLGMLPKSPAGPPADAGGGTKH